MLVKNLKENKKEKIIENNEEIKNVTIEQEPNNVTSVKKTTKKKSKKRMFIVLTFSIVALIMGYITLRGHFLEKC